MTKIGRNDPCLCGSGKKYKYCCMDDGAKQRAELLDELEQVLAMNPNLTLDEINAVAACQMQQRNSQPIDDFCGLSADQMQNWLYAPFHSLLGVEISTPTDFSNSPVMRYVEIIIAEAMANGGRFKATSKGNLPTKIVKAANSLRPELSTSDYPTHVSISEFEGSNEDKFNALHYARILAEIAGIIYLRSGYFHLKKDAQKQYQKHGLAAFFLPMLEAAVTRYNWRYFDSFDDEVDLRMFWVFMIWRLQRHRSVDQLIREAAIAFPQVWELLPNDTYAPPERIFARIIESRFIERCLEFWGFVKADPERYVDFEKAPRNVKLQPLFEQSFKFDV
ncbi:MAG: SEC-C domain-containing protein [Idiomarina sp.]|nr:SEC-C domain-containing protein [Idiomarina sp.]